MSETKHTQGPWRINKYGSIGAGERGTEPIVAIVEPFYSVDRRHGDHAANARLIAAAPDMLEALTALLARFDDNPELSELIGRVEIERARAAIAKAEGRS